MLPVRSVQGTVNPPSLQVSGISIANGRAVIEVDLLSGSVPASWTLQSKQSLTDSWGTASTTVEVVSPTHFRFDVATTAGEAHRFYQILAN
jgi:hypothetical protein